MGARRFLPLAVVAAAVVALQLAVSAAGAVGAAAGSAAPSMTLLPDCRWPVMMARASVMPRNRAARTTVALVRTLPALAPKTVSVMPPPAMPIPPCDLLS